MLGFRYLTSPPTRYVLQFRNGEIINEGAGKSFFYFVPTTTIVSVELASVDVPFVFEEVSADFQEVTIQGQLTFRVAQPKQLVKLMNYTVDARGRYVSDDPERLRERLIQLAQVRAHRFTQSQTLMELLPQCEPLGADLLEALRTSEIVAMLGIEILALSVLSIKATPEMGKAMQAEAREQLLLRADQAVYARRNIAIELEQKLKEAELETERAIEEKKRAVRQAQMQADIAIEQQRSELVDEQVANQTKLAASDAEALRAKLAAVRGMDWKTLTACTGGGNPKALIAMAFEELAENASKIGRLDISSDVLKKLLDERDE